jgi:hypothetical protein
LSGLIAGRTTVLGWLRHSRIDEARQLIEVLLINPADRLLPLTGGRAFGERFDDSTTRLSSPKSERVRV